MSQGGAALRPLVMGILPEFWTKANYTMVLLRFGRPYVIQCAF